MVEPVKRGEREREREREKERKDVVGFYEWKHGGEDAGDEQTQILTVRPSPPSSPDLSSFLSPPMRVHFYSINYVVNSGRK